jgi:hypothetical protein
MRDGVPVNRLKLVDTPVKPVRNGLLFAREDTVWHACVMGNRPGHPLLIFIRPLQMILFGCEQKVFRASVVFKSGFMS